MITTIKKLNMHCFFIALILLTAFSCADKDKVKDTKDIAEDKNEKMIITTTKVADAQFVVNASEINMEEIKLGQLAQQKSKMDHVKELGKAMQDEHTKAQVALTNLAKTKMFAIPTNDTQKTIDTYKDLNKKTGKDFDIAYSTLMVNGHNTAISLFEKTATESNDPEIKAWCNEMLPTLRMHLNEANTCLQECEKMMKNK